MPTTLWWYPRIEKYGNPCPDPANYRTFGGFLRSLHVVMTPNLQGQTWNGLISPAAKSSAGGDVVSGLWGYPQATIDYSGGYREPWSPFDTELTSGVRVAIAEVLVEEDLGQTEPTEDPEPIESLHVPTNPPAEVRQSAIVEAEIEFLEANGQPCWKDFHCQCAECARYGVLIDELDAAHAFEKRAAL